ncbi:unnamed protein product, partial [Mesorhabditis belari]|uniref:28S ribosomal protein S18b, mitochondrial n=1 Tax=Mesorhabditis belari TaxID=2138241 RepID=A0AAF3J6F7_9BILA
MLRCGRSISQRLISTSQLSAGQKKTETLPTPEEAGWAFNHVEKKKGLYKPKHNIEEQISYMKSKAYLDAYQGLPVHRSYKRNFKGQYMLQPPPRLFCIDKHGRFNVNHACPICRDEYLFFDFRNPGLILQFLQDGTVQPLDILKTGLCREQYNLLSAQLLKAKEHGKITFGVEFRNFDYRQYYPWWTEEPSRQVSRGGLTLPDIHPDPLIEFDAFKPETKTWWDQYWLRHDKFAKKGK